VTHHVDEIPPGFTHVLMLNEGRITASGPLDTTMTSATLSACFGLALELNRHNGRFSAWAL
jgi:iron complex transport system ATP-binding protein